jgi:DegV family protein with EDD domain
VPSLGDTIPVVVIDSEAVTMAQGLIVLDVAEAAAAGAALNELAERATSLRERCGVVGTLDAFEHLIKGGRYVGGAKALLGSVLSVKPLLRLEDGVVAEAGRQRTRSKALATCARRGPFSGTALSPGRGPRRQGR